MEKAIKNMETLRKGEKRKKKGNSQSEDILAILEKEDSTSTKEDRGGLTEEEYKRYKKLEKARIVFKSLPPEFEEEFQRLEKKRNMQNPIEQTENNPKEEIENNPKEETKDNGEILQKLRGDTDAIIKYLKENCIGEENVEMMGHKGKKVHINLPKIEGKFEGFKFEYFVSNKYVYKGDFESNPELENKSYSMKDVGGLLGAMNKYMQAMGVETDGDMDYENDLKFWKTDNYRCDAGDCLKQIAGLDYWYWLKDKNVDGKRDSRAGWDCNDGNCYFARLVNADNHANLFLRLSD